MLRLERVGRRGPVPPSILDAADHRHAFAWAMLEIIEQSKLAVGEQALPGPMHFRSFVCHGLKRDPLAVLVAHFHAQSANAKLLDQRCASLG